MRLAFILAAALAVSPVVVAAQDAAVAGAAPVTPVAGKMLYSTNGARLASIYRVDASGAPQLIVDGHLITIPVSTLAQAGGKITTTLTRADLSR